jgi:hypothetical protein
MRSLSRLRASLAGGSFAALLSATVLCVVLLGTGACTGKNEFAGPTVPGDSVPVVTPPTGAVDSIPPLVAAAVSRAISPGDSLIVNASDNVGVRVIGYEVRLRGALVKRDSGFISPAAKIASLRVLFPFGSAQLGDSLIISVFARDSLLTGYGTAGTTPVSDSTQSVKTVAIVTGGIFQDFGANTNIVDMIWHPTRNELYAINNSLNRVEVLDPLTGVRLRSLPAGALPVKASLMPLDNAGSYADQIIIADSGSTQLTIVDAGTAATSAVRLGKISMVTYNIDSTGKTTNVVARSSDIGDRPSAVAVMCLPYASGPGCAETYAMIGTGSPANANTTTPFYGVRYIGLTGPRANMEGLVLGYACQCGATDSVLVNASIHSFVTGTDSTLVSGYPASLSRLLPPGIFMVASSGDFRSVMAGSAALVGPGRIFESNTFSGFNGTRQTNDIAANLGGRLLDVKGNGTGAGIRFALLTDHDLAIADTATRLRASTNVQATGFAFVQSGVPGVADSLIVLATGTAAAPTLTFYNMLNDLATTLATVPVRRQMIGSLVAILRPGGASITVIAAGGSKLTRVVVPTSLLNGSTGFNPNRIPSASSSLRSRRHR